MKKRLPRKYKKQLKKTLVGSILYKAKIDDSFLTPITNLLSGKNSKGENIKFPLTYLTENKI